ncbi:MAG: hypothetical protein C5B59_19550 [Bacteroidetes bacterium]|nr:MAG: hypothetical protein C5B59_19550 [Bacteroidota bacterium]
MEPLPFSDFRKSDPEKYESYADIGMNEWIKMKIVVDHAQLFINDSKQPCLIVNDLKYGADRRIFFKSENFKLRHYPNISLLKRSGYEASMPAV